MKDEKLDWLTNITKRSYRQTEHLANLTDSFEELCLLEENIKNCHICYCPDDRNEVQTILNLEPRKKWFSIPKYDMKEFLTLSLLIQHLLQIQENQGKDTLVFISEKVIDGKGDEKTVIRQLEKGDITVEGALDQTAAWLISQGTKGVVIGFVPTVE